MKKYFILLFVVLFQITHAQKALSSTELEQAKQGYLDMMKSESYKQIENIDWEFVEKLNGLEIPKEYWPDPALYLKFISDNFQKTKFKNIGEAENLLNIQASLYKKQIADFSTLYDLMKNASVDQLKEILKPETGKIRTK